MLEIQNSKTNSPPQQTPKGACTKDKIKNRPCEGLPSPCEAYAHSAWRVIWWPHWRPCCPPIEQNRLALPGHSYREGEGKSEADLFKCGHKQTWDNSCLFNYYCILGLHCWLIVMYSQSVYLIPMAVYLQYLETFVDLGDINLINKTNPFPELWLHSLLNSWTNMVKLRGTLQIWLLTMSQEDGCAPRGWSCLEGTAGWRLKGRYWGHWGGATGDCWGALRAEPECPPPQVAAQTWGCILFLLQWFSTVGWGEKNAF